MKTLEISDETYEKIKDQLGPTEEPIVVAESADLKGHCFLFRTVTYHVIGRVKACFGTFVELEEASWLADSGRFMNALKDGVLNEVEPIIPCNGQAFVNLAAVTDFYPWTHALPRVQK